MISSTLLLGVLGSVPGFICFLCFFLPLSLLIGSAILIAAISLINKLTGHNKRRSDSIPVPSVIEGMGIVLVAFLVNSAINFVLGFIMGVEGIDLNSKEVPFSDAIAFQLMACVIIFLANSAVYSAMLPTTFLRAMGVAFFQIVIVVFNVLMVVLVVVGLISVFRGM